MSVKLRSYRNVSAVPLEICEVGKPIKSRVRVEPNEISPLVRVSDDWNRYITETTGFAQVMDEQDDPDWDTPEGYVDITQVGDKTRKFRPMTGEEREQAGLSPVATMSREPLPAVVVKPNTAVRPGVTPAVAPIPSTAAPVVAATPTGQIVAGTGTGTAVGTSKT